MALDLLSYIKALQDIHARHGNLGVQTNGLSGRFDAPTPTAVHELALGPKQSRPRFFRPGQDDEAKRGPMVVKV